MKYCEDCKKLVDEGSKPRTEHYEYWGANISHTYEDPCCPECGGEDLSDPWTCPCGEQIPPGEKLCENCRDNLTDIKKEIRNLFPGIAPINQTTVEEYLINNLFPRLTPMEWRDGGWEL